MKKLFFALSLLLLSMTASAQYTKSIRLSADDGTDVLLSLSRSLNIRFDNTNLIASDNGQTITVSLDKVKIEYSTDKAPTGIADVQEDRGYTIGDGTITFQGLKAGQTVRVFSVDGKLMMTVPANNDGGKTSIELSTLPKGVSIIHAGKYNLKYSRN